MPDPSLEQQSERVPLADVMERRVWFPHAGLFFLWDGDELVYIGLTACPLRQRLYLAMANKKTWTKADHAGWLVSMQRTPEYPDDLMLHRRLVHERKPRFNVTGRPRSRTA
jgi:hypothetical protein